MTKHKGLIFGVPFVLITLAVIFVLALIFTTGQPAAVEETLAPTLEQPQQEEAVAPAADPAKPKVTYEKHD